MATERSAAQELGDSVIPLIRPCMTWQEINVSVDVLAQEIANEHSGAKVYGIPRGGQIVAGLLQAHGYQVVDSWQNATVIVDDIIDSGKTKTMWQTETGLPVFALIYKIPGMGWVRFPWEHAEEHEPGTSIQRLLEQLDLDVTSEGLRDTPARLARLLVEMTSGRFDDLDEILGRTFDGNNDEIVVVRGIPFWSLCEHHLMPFHGHATVGYLPARRVLGLSKIPRLVKSISRRPQLQERMTAQIAEALMANEGLNPLGVGVTLVAKHACMAMRGIESEGEMVTSSVLGMFRQNPNVKAEWLRLL